MIIFNGKGVLKYQLKRQATLKWDHIHLFQIMHPSVCCTRNTLPSNTTTFYKMSLQLHVSTS